MAAPLRSRGASNPALRLTAWTWIGPRFRRRCLSQMQQRSRAAARPRTSRHVRSSRPPTSARAESQRCATPRSVSETTSYLCPANNRRGPACERCERHHRTALLDLLAEDSRLNVYAGELEVRPPGAPTTDPRQEAVSGL